MVRLRLLLKGRFRKWTDENIRALQTIRPLLTDESCSILDEFERSRNGRVHKRLGGLWESGVYRQTLLGNLGLIAASLLKKI